MQPYKGDRSSFYTALFFEKQDKHSLIDAINKFDSLTFNRKKLSNYAKNFSEENFKIKLKKYVLNYNN